jgi:hypothetical protein
MIPLTDLEIVGNYSEDDAMVRSNRTALTFRIANLGSFGIPQVLNDQLMALEDETPQDGFRTPPPLAVMDGCSNVSSFSGRSSTASTGPTLASSVGFLRGRFAQVRSASSSSLLALENMEAAPGSGSQEPTEQPPDPTSLVAVESAHEPGPTPNTEQSQSLDEVAAAAAILADESSEEEKSNDDFAPACGILIEVESVPTEVISV